MDDSKIATSERKTKETLTHNTYNTTLYVVNIVCTAVVQIMALANALKTSKCISIRRTAFHTIKSCKHTHTKREWDIFVPIRIFYTHIQMDPIQFKSKQNKERWIVNEQARNTVDEPTKSNKRRVEKWKKITKTKALKIEMEIKRSEMCKILLFFFFFNFNSVQQNICTIFFFVSIAKCGLFEKEKGDVSRVSERTQRDRKRDKQRTYKTNQQLLR